MKTPEQEAIDYLNRMRQCPRRDWYHAGFECSYCVVQGIRIAIKKEQENIYSIPEETREEIAQKFRRGEI